VLPQVFLPVAEHKIFNGRHSSRLIISVQSVNIAQEKDELGSNCAEVGSGAEVNTVFSAAGNLAMIDSGHRRT